MQILSINSVMSSYSKHRSTQHLALGDTSCYQTVLQRVTKPLHCGIFVSIANDASALLVIVVIYLLSLMIQMQHHLVFTPSTPSPVAKGSDRFTPFRVVIMVRGIPSFLSVLPGKVFDFSLFCEVMTATVVNLHSFKVSYLRKSRGKRYASDFFTEGCTYFHLGASG